MAMEPEDLQGELYDIDEQVARINAWGAGVDEWGNQVDEYGEDLHPWREGVDEWGRQVDRWGQVTDQRIGYVSMRQRDQQEQLNHHHDLYVNMDQRVTVLQRLSHVVPIWPLIVGAVVGVVTGLLVADNTNRDEWWCVGIGIAAGAIAAGLCYLVSSVIDSQGAAEQVNVQQVQQANVHNQQQNPPPAPPARTEEPTQQMPPVHHPNNPTPQPAPAAAAPNQ